MEFFTTSNKKRSCGNCTMCCHHLGIQEFGVKPCPKEDPCIGCTIYDHRPQTCRNYNCLWLYGWGTEDMKPDRCGVIVDSRPLPEIGMMISVKECEQGAMNGEVKKLLGEMAKKQVVFIQSYDGKHTGFYHPKEMKEKVVKAQEVMHGYRKNS